MLHRVLVPLDRVAELAPGSPAASRATLHRGRIVWRVRGDREAALDVLLDAFIHSPASAWGDSARTESRAVARLLHYERIANGEVPVPQIEGEGLARSTAMYRLAEEVLEEERDREAAIVYDKQRNASVEQPDEKAEKGRKKIAVKLGISNGVKTELVSGLAEGQKVILQ